MKMTPETLVDEYCTIKIKLENCDDSVWEEISQILLPENFIRDFKENLHWNWIPTNNQLYEDFIQEFQEYG
jgi:hypothetical protein